MPYSSTPTPIMAGVNRTRTRGSTSTYQVFPFYQDLWNGITSTPSPTTFTAYPPVIESISDVVRAKRVSSYRNYTGEVTHSKREIQVPDLEPFTCRFASNPSRVRKFFPSGWLPDVPTISVPNPSGWISSGSWCDRQLRQLAESAPAQMSLPNFLLELRDISQTLEGIQKLRHLIDGKKSIREIVKGVAQGNLTYNFGVKTTFNDVLNLLYAHERAVKRLLWLRKNNNKRIVVKSKRSGITYISSTTAWSGYPGLNGVMGVKRDAIEARVTEVVGAQVYQKFFGLDDKLAELSVLRGQLGFNKPFSVVWEAIPFTWLVDYFLNIGELVDSIPSIPSFQGTPQLSQPWYSRKVEYSVNATYTLQSTMTFSSASFEGRIAYRQQCKSYFRTGTIPSGYSPRLLSGSLSGSQITNFLALLLSKGL